MNKLYIAKCVLRGTVSTAQVLGVLIVAVLLALTLTAFEVYFSPGLLNNIGEMPVD
jgi:hypothetical protein